MSVDLTIKDHVARVTIDRPDRMNAINSETEGPITRDMDGA